MDRSPDNADVDPDALLMAKAGRGDDQALAVLIDRWQKPLLNFFFRSLDSVADAEDLAQSVFIKLHRAAPRYQPSARFSTYLFHIARRVLLNEYRRRGRKPVCLLPPKDLPGVAPPEPRLQLMDLEEIFQHSLARMPENHRTDILLLKQQELSYAEIAAIMDTSEGMVKTWIFRARVGSERRTEEQPMTSRSPDPRHDLNSALDELFRPRELGGPDFSARTMRAVRQASGRRTRSARRFAGWAAAIAAAAFLLLAVRHDPAETTIAGRPGGAEVEMVAAGDAAFYGEMVALDDLLSDAAILAKEENRQTLDLLIYVTQN